MDSFPSALSQKSTNSGAPKYAVTEHRPPKVTQNETTPLRQKTYIVMKKPDFYKRLDPHGRKVYDVNVTLKPLTERFIKLMTRRGGARMQMSLCSTMKKRESIWQRRIWSFWPNFILPMLSFI